VADIDQRSFKDSIVAVKHSTRQPKAQEAKRRPRASLFYCAEWTHRADEFAASIRKSKRA
jgi:hypothetical protein